MAESRGAERALARGWVSRHDLLASGVATGIGGGLLMMGIAMAGAASEGLSPLHPARVLGATFVGPDGGDGVVGNAAFGLLVHLVTSVAMATLLAAILPRDFPTPGAMVVGVGFVLLSFMLVLMPLLVPRVNPGFRDGMQAVGGAWTIGLGVLGVVLGFVPALRRRLVGEASPGVVGARAEARA